MTRNRILEATLELACEKGLGRISMSQIAAKVNLKKSSLYSHFESKEQIIESMYEYFRNKAKVQTGNTETDYGKLVEGRSFKEVLMFAVNSYRQMNRDSDMDKFYRLIESERIYNPSAAMIMVEETNKMIAATKSLFYAMAAKGITSFENPDAAAISFAMTVHSILVFECDARMAGVDADGMMETFIDEFCRIYG